MAVIERITPPSKRQSLTDSCWAAVLEVWSIADLRLRSEGSYLREMDLVGEFGEGRTGGLNPVTKFPDLCRRFKLFGAAYDADFLVNFLKLYLGKGHVFCAHRRDKFHHAILIYRYDEDSGYIHFMDPDPGTYSKQKAAWFDARSPLLLARLDI